MRKTFKVVKGPRYNPTVTTIQLAGVEASERLTPRMARRACYVAFGTRYDATVWDGERGYVLYKSSQRKIQGE